MTKPPDPVHHPGMPGIYLYPQRAENVDLRLAFRGTGFLTDSTPEYNAQWRVHVDPAAPFNRFSSRFGQDATAYPYLDYDGFRDGQFQTKAGWCVKKDALLDWQRVNLREIGFTDSEIDDANYTYGRLLLERRYRAEYFAIYPQDTAAVDASVSLEISPAPDSIYRLWLYFVPVNNVPALQEPHLARVPRRGFAVVELGYLTDREIPGGGKSFASRAGNEVHPVAP